MLDHHHPHLSIHVTEDYLTLNALDKSFADSSFSYASLSPPSDPDAPDSPDHADSISPPPSASSPPATLSYSNPYDVHRRSASFEDDLYAPRTTSPAGSQHQQHTPQYAYYPLEGGPSSPPSPSDLASLQRLGQPHRLSIDAHSPSNNQQYAFDAARRLSEPNARLRMATAGPYPPSLPSLASISSSLPSPVYPSHHLSLHTSSYAYAQREDAFGHHPHQRIRAEEFSPRPGHARGYTYPSTSSQHHQSHWDYASPSSDSTNAGDARRQSVSGSGPLTTEPLSNSAAGSATTTTTMTATSAVDTPATGLSVGIGIGLDVGINGELGTGSGVGGTGSSSLESVSVGLQEHSQGVLDAYNQQISYFHRISYIN